MHFSCGDLYPVANQGIRYRGYSVLEKLFILFFLSLFFFETVYRCCHLLWVEGEVTNNDMFTAFCQCDYGKVGGDCGWTCTRTLICGS